MSGQDMSDIHTRAQLVHGMVTSSFLLPHVIVWCILFDRIVEWCIGDSFSVQSHVEASSMSRYSTDGVLDSTSLPYHQMS